MEAAIGVSYVGLYFRDSIGIMERKVEATIVE